MAEDERALLENLPDLVPRRASSRAPYTPDVAPRGRRDARARRHPVRDAQRPRPLAGAPRLPRGRLPLLRRRPLRGLGRPHRPAGRRLGDARRVDPHAHRPLSAGDDRLFRATARRRRSAPSSSRNPFLARAARLVTTFEAPRGTHDILPSEQPLWRLVTGEAERLCALYGYRPIQTPVLRGHGALHAHVRRGLRRRAEGDVHLRGPRRPLADASARGDRADRARLPRARPAPRARSRSSSTRSRPCTGTRRRSAGRYREHWQLSVEAIGSADPAVDAEVIQLYDELLRAPRRDDVRAPAELDRRRELPARVPRAADRLARRARGRARRRRAAEARDEPAARLRREERRRSRRRSPTRRRSATRSATTAARTSTPCRRTSRTTASSSSSIRRSCAGSTTTRARPSSSSTRRSARRARSAAAAATTA